MAKEENKVEVENVKHDNIFSALSAFQGENPEIVQSKKVSFKDNKGGTVEYSYAPLDEILKTIRPLLAKHGLSVTFGGDKDGQLICSLYHTTYKVDTSFMKKEKITTHTEPHGVDTQKQDGSIEKDYVPQEVNVIRSLPIKVKRGDNMKDIGSDSTYARRYMLAEVLGIASDEDKDAEIEEKSKTNTENFAYKSLVDGIKSAKTEKALMEKIEFLNKELLTAQEGKKAPSLGLKAEQYEKLLTIANDRLTEIKGVEKTVDITPPQDGAVDPSELPDFNNEK